MTRRWDVCGASFWDIRAFVQQRCDAVLLAIGAASAASVDPHIAAQIDADMDRLD